MPAITKGKVLVTGANGYVALWVVKSLLEAGYSVRGTVRRESAIAHLKKTFAEHADRLEVVVVPDITKEGAFDEAVKGVDAIEHTASPFHFNATTPEELIEPAVAGTRSVLQSALTHANGTVKRVVLTSSTAAVFSSAGLPRALTEVDWNDETVAAVEANGANVPPVLMYLASKTLAEKAAWKFVEEHKGEVKFDLVALNPPFVFGPILQEVAKPDALNTSMGDWFNTVIKGSRSDEELVTIKNSWVDVRDVGTAHTLALQKEEAGGERILVSAGEWTWQDFVNAAHSIDSSLPKGNTSYDAATTVHPVSYNTAKAARIFGLQYKKLNETTKDLVEQFKTLGWY